MLELPDNDTTSANLTLGVDYNGVLERAGDRDWLRLDLAAGEWVLTDI